jgi:signal transduction histidine kinase/DNA-binding response OmpR family regulator
VDQQSVPDELAATLREKEALYRVTSAIIERTDVGDLLQVVVDSIAEALPADRVVLITFDLHAKRVIHFVKGGVGAQFVVDVSFNELQHGLSGWVLRENAPALSPRTSPDPRELPDVQKRRAETNCGDIIVVPLRYHASTLGTLTAINLPHGAPFCQRQVDMMMAMASHSAVAITTAQYHQQLEREIQGRNALEASLAQARDHALDASRLKSEFLANMSHEIRTPMNAILGMLKLLQSTALTMRQREYASKTEGAAQSLLGLLNDVLDFSKIEAGKLSIDRHPMRLESVLRDLSVVVSANLGTKPIDVLFDLDHDLPDCVYGDAMRLQQVLINLAGNAIKFTEAGEVVIAVRKRRETVDSITVEFSVLDTGIGIAPDQQSRLFSAFSQAEGSTTRRFGGTGLGLAICKRLVELMGGHIAVMSTLGVGSKFTFALEFKLVRRPPPELGQSTSTAVMPQRALIVDDNPRARQLLTSMVSSWGWHADATENGASALKMLQSRSAGDPSLAPYDVIFTDCQMPVMDGWELTRRIRALPWQETTPRPFVVMLSGTGSHALVHRLSEEQEMIDGYVVKPITAHMLMNAYLLAAQGAGNVSQLTVGRSSERALEGMRILVVEDNLVNQQVVEELLNAEGAVVSLASNGRQGVEAVAAALPQFDVVLMDIQMPILDGYGATREIRDRLGLRQLPVFAMTANVMPSDRIACLAAGMDEHIGKPFDLDELVALLRSRAQASRS